MSTKVKIVEVTEKSFEGRKYYTFMVCSPDEVMRDATLHDDEKIKLSAVNGSNYHKVGDIATLGFGRNKEYRLTVRVL